MAVRWSDVDCAPAAGRELLSPRRCHEVLSCSSAATRGYLSFTHAERVPPRARRWR